MLLNRFSHPNTPFPHPGQSPGVPRVPMVAHLCHPRRKMKAFPSQTQLPLAGPMARVTCQIFMVKSPTHLPKSPMQHTSKMTATFEEISILHFFYQIRYLPHPFKNTYHTIPNKKHIFLYQNGHWFTQIAAPSRGTWDLPAPPARPEQCRLVVSEVQGMSKRSTKWDLIIDLIFQLQYIF